MGDLEHVFWNTYFERKPPCSILSLEAAGLIHSAWRRITGHKKILLSPVAELETMNSFSGLCSSTGEML